MPVAAQPIITRKMPPAKMEEPFFDWVWLFFSVEREEVSKKREKERNFNYFPKKNLSLPLFTTHSHVLPPREEPQRRPGPDRERDAAQEQHVAHRQQAPVEEERDAEEGEEDAKGRQADADFCFWFVFVLFV